MKDQKKGTTTYNGKEVETIDCTPSWQAALQIYLAVLETTKSKEGRDNAMAGLRQMANVAQRCVDVGEDLFNIINVKHQRTADKIVEDIITYLIKNGIYGKPQVIDYDKYIGREFVMNNFINTITAVDDEFITYTMRNKAGKKFEGFQRVGINFLYKIDQQLADQHKLLNNEGNWIYVDSITFAHSKQAFKNGVFSCLVHDIDSKSHMILLSDNFTEGGAHA